MGVGAGKDGTAPPKKGQKPTQPIDIDKLDPEKTTRLELKNKGIVSLPDNVSVLQNLKWFNLPHNHLTTLPEAIGQLTNLHTLRLLSNQIKSLPESFVNLSNLTCLDLGQNQLEVVPPALQNLLLLNELNLHSNKLNSVPQELSNLTNLKTLTIYINNLKELPIIPSVEVLDVAHNHITTLPENTHLCSSLTSLNLAGNDFTQLNDNFCGFTALKTVDLRHNVLESLPNNFGRLSDSLKHFKLIHNCLESVPNCLGTLTALEELVLGQNRIKSIPESLGELKLLKTLHIFENKLESLPSSIGQLVNLTELDISHNLLKELPSTTGNLSSLITFYCTHNAINSLNVSHISGLKSLQEFNLSNNDISVIPEECTLMVQLQKLSFTCNHIKTLPDLSSLATIKWIELAWNRVTEFPMMTCSIKSLVILNLFANNIKKVPPEVAELAMLEKLYLSYNKLKELPDQFSSLTKLKDLFLGGNRFKHFPNQILKLEGLKELCMSNNKIAEFPKDMYKLSQLGSLHMTNNRLKALWPSIDKCITLTELDLSHNFIEELPPEFSELANLTDLDLSGNCMQYLVDLTQLTQLTHLVTGFNRLRTIPKLTGKNGTLPWISCTGNWMLYQYYTLENEANAVKIIDQIEKEDKKREKELSKSKERPLSKSHAKKGKKEDEPSIDMVRVSSIKGCKRYRSHLGWSEMRGRRPDMQDTLTIVDDFGENRDQLIAIFDGHSGVKSAEIAAKRMPVLLCSNLAKVGQSKPNNNPDSEASIKEAFVNTFRDVHTEIESLALEDGTAALVILIQQSIKRIIVANAGDERAVICVSDPGTRADQVIQLTIDHKPDLPSEKKRIQEVGGFVTETKRVDGILALSRAIGDCDLQPHVTYVPEVWILDMTKMLKQRSNSNHEPQSPKKKKKQKDKEKEKDDDSDGELSYSNCDFIILACDGLWDVCSNEQAVSLVRKYEDPVAAATALRDYAHLLGSTDNISVIVYYFNMQNSLYETVATPESH